MSDAKSLKRQREISSSVLRYSSFGSVSVGRHRIDSEGKGRERPTFVFRGQAQIRTERGIDEIFGAARRGSDVIYL